MKKKNGYLEIERTGDCVTWAYGHILCQKTPEMYDERYKSWGLDLLPIVPTAWGLFVKPEAKEQFHIIETLIQRADAIVNAGDPDREGQLLIDEILEYVKNKKPVQRILLNALDEKSVKEALRDLRDNADYVGLKNSALARSRADWLIGINLTRAFTELARQMGYSGVWRVGRVKTPTMALVVRREREIKNFQEKKHYKLEVQFKHENGMICTAWKPGEEFQALDGEGRILQRGDAENVLKKLCDVEDMRIADCLEEQHNENPRLPYSLSALQIEAGKKFGYSPKDVLDTAQKLYEAKYTTYPRSDCDFLPENQIKDAAVILENIGRQPGWKDRFEKANLSLRSKAWNDGKISAHHAIIPTTLFCDVEKLDEIGKNIYCMIAQAYLAQFYPAHVYSKIKLVIRAGGYSFVTSGKTVLQNGWKELYFNEEKVEVGEPALPMVCQGDAVTIQEGQVREMVTKPPKRFSSASLLEAMKNIHKYLRNSEYKDCLKTVSGIGTEATRAGIIDDLIGSGFLRQEKKLLVPTEVAENLFDALSDGLTYPDMTAVWEDKLAQIASRDFAYESFASASADMVKTLLKDALAAKIAPPLNQPVCPSCQKAIICLKGKNGMFWKCNGCNTTFQDVKGKPEIVICPKCKSGFLRRRQNKTKANYFWACNLYPNCKATFTDNKGKPQL